MNRSVIKNFFAVGLLGLLMNISLQAQANITFTFEQTGGTVIMTSSGVLDTTKLISVDLPDGWGGTGTENNDTPGDIDIMGGTSSGDVDTQFGFSPGTNASAITNPGGPFFASNFSVASIEGSKSFTTYAGFEGGLPDFEEGLSGSEGALPGIGELRVPGIGVRAVDIVDGFWTPDQNWTYNPGDTLESLGLRPGIYSVSDLETGETITINIGQVAPVPALDNLALILLVAAVLLMGGLVLRYKNTA